MAAPDSATELRRLVNGYQVSQAIHVAASLGIADRLTAAPRPVSELAAELGAHAESLYRLLRALAAVGLFHEDDDRRFSLAPLGECLRADSAHPLAPWAIFIGQAYVREAWGDLLHSVMTGENAVRHRHGCDGWEYRRQHPAQSAIFDRAMAGNSDDVANAILSSYDMGRFGKIADIGGGQGEFLASILAAEAEVRGILVDLPHVVARAPALFQSKGVASRCEIAGGSFFESVPAGADAYVLMQILHDWTDDEAAAILGNCRRAMSSDETLLVIERLVAPPNQGAETKFSDLNMLVLPGGRERTREQFAALFDRAGFALTEAVSTGTRLFVIEGRPGAPR